ncbi:hypothetical protein O181_018071 [Austropuccinia psidii MF-1]|uniref:Uncharacterized protein n=1 Tax=Austropuccinia psidii MF-1 TaxID=1389203 RepID=A0A9Q3C8W2_9BASI|nr:hypothetical protein [Austropuccinia psidii MF-1]
MELVDYIDGLFIYEPSIRDCWITARLNKAFKAHAIIWYTEMKQIYGMRSWPWQKSQKSKSIAMIIWIPLPKSGEAALANLRKELQSESGKMRSVGTIIKEIIIPHRQGDIRLNPEFVVLEDAHIQGFLLGMDYQRMYGIDTYSSQNRNITIGTNKEKKFSVDIYQMSTHNPLEE